MRKLLLVLFATVSFLSGLNAQSQNLQGSYLGTGYFFHPTSPRALYSTKTITKISTNTYQLDLADLGASGYSVQFTIDAFNNLTNWQPVGSTPISPASGFMTIDNPGGFSFYPGSTTGYLHSTYSNRYDVATKTFYLHYGYQGGGTGQSQYQRQVYEKFEFLPPPVVTSITPNTGTSGTMITINGNNFSRVDTYYGIHIGNELADSSVIVSNTQIKAWVGKGATGKININNADSSQTFTYIKPKVATNTDWQYVGNAGFAGRAYYSAISMDSSTPYVAYVDSAIGQKVYVQKYNGTNWVAVGSNVSAGKSSHTNITIGSNKVPYVAYIDSSNGNKITVQKFNGSSWVIVGNAGFAPYHNPSSDNMNIPLDVDGNNNPYVLSRDTTGNLNSIYVYRFNGTSWVNLGKAGQFVWESALAVDKLSNTPYVLFDDGASTAIVKPATVVKYNGTAWLTVGNTDFSTTVFGIYYSAIKIDATGTPIVSFQDDNGYERLSTFKLVNNVWTPIGYKYFSKSRVYNNALALDKSNNPIQLFSDRGLNYQGSVLSYGNGAWDYVGTRGFLPCIGGVLSENGMAVSSNNTPYIIFNDINNGNRMSVMKFIRTLCNTPVSITIAGNKSGVVCAGTKVTYTATVSGGCGSTSYQWYKSGVAVGTNSVSYADSTLLQGDSIYCVATSGTKTYNSNKLAVAADAGLLSPVILTTIGGGNLTPSVGMDAKQILGNINSGIAFDSAGNGYCVAGTNLIQLDSANKIKAVLPFGAIANGEGIGIAVYNNEVYYSSIDYQKVFKTNISTGKVTLVAGTGINGFSGDGGLAVNAQLSIPKGLSIDKNGNLFITDNNNHRIRKVNLSTGIITTVVGSGLVTNQGGFGSFGGDGGLATAASLSFPWDVKVDNAGNLYIADASAIRFVNGTTGIISSLAGNGTPAYKGDGGLAVNAQVYYPKSLVVDKKGNVIFADGSEVLRKINMSTGVISSISGKFNNYESCGDGGYAANATFNAGLGLSVDKYDNLYLEDNGSKSIRKIFNFYNKPQVFISSSACGSVCKGIEVFFSAIGVYTGANPIYQWKKNGVNVGTNSTQYVDFSLNPNDSITCNLTSNTNCVISGTVQSNTLKPAVYLITTPTVNVTASATSVSNGTPVTFTATINNGGTAPYYQWIKNGNEVGTNKNTYIDSAIKNADSIWCILTSSIPCATISTKKSNVTKITVGVITGTIISTYAGNGVGAFSGDNGKATSASLNYPDAIVTDNAGNVYIGDRVNSRVRKVNKNGIITTVVGNGTSGFSGDNGSALLASITTPWGLAVDAAGNLYIADGNNHRIRKVNPNGIITTIAGTGKAGFSGDNGLATAAQFNLPTGVAVDAIGNVFVVDQGNQRIRRISIDGIINTIAGNGVAGFSGDGGLATNASFKDPYGIAIDVADYKYITDVNNNRIRKIDPNGMITTVAGNGTLGYYGEGMSATSTGLDYPMGITVDASKNLYFTDSWLTGALKVSANGILTKLAGGGSGTFCGDGGLATTACLNKPRGIAIDGDGNIYITDTDNHRVRKIGSTGGLPILFSEVSATAINSSIRTQWQSSNEINTDYFNIEHSVDGINFTTIGKITAVGSGANRYQFTDLTPLNGLNYYRIQSIDKDGSINTSKVVTASIAKADLDFSIYPNPVKSSLFVNLAKTTSANYRLRIMNLTGIAVFNKSVVNAINSTITLPVSNLAAGVYFLELTDVQGNKQLKKFVKE